MFLALALGSLVALEMLLISGGVLGAIPLSGVRLAVPQLRKLSDASHFFLFALILSIQTSQPARLSASRSQDPCGYSPSCWQAALWPLSAERPIFRRCMIRNYLARDTRVIEEDGVNETSIIRGSTRLRVKFHEAIFTIARGSFWPPAVGLSSSDAARTTTSSACRSSSDSSPFDNRHYPFGAVTAHVLGDLRTATTSMPRTRRSSSTIPM